MAVGAGAASNWTPSAGSWCCTAVQVWGCGMVWDSRALRNWCSCLSTPCCSVVRLCCCCAAGRMVRLMCCMQLLAVGCWGPSTARHGTGSHAGTAAATAALSQPPQRAGRHSQQQQQCSHRSSKRSSHRSSIQQQVWQVLVHHFQHSSRTCQVVQALTNQPAARTPQFCSYRAALSCGEPPLWGFCSTAWVPGGSTAGAVHTVDLTMTCHSIPHVVVTVV